MKMRFAALLAGGGMFLAACQPAAAPAPTQVPAPTTAPTPLAASMALHVSYGNLIADNLPEWVALESGIFKQNGLDVTVNNVVSSTGIPALLSGQVQIAH